MKTLFVFDSCVDVEKIDKIDFNRGDLICLFSLTSKPSINKAVSEKIRNKGCGVDMLQVATMINLSADRLRDKYVRFIAEFPDLVRHRGKNLKEFFAIDRYATLWWLGLISEKNTYKSDAFNRLAQFDSIVDCITHRNIERVLFWCGCRKIEDVLSRYLSENSIRFEVLSAKPTDNLKKRLLRSQGIFYLRHTLLLLNFTLRLSLRAWRIKQGCGNLSRDLGSHDETLLLISPYPNIDIPSARRGIFKNKYYPCLQEALESEGKNIVWISMYVDNNSISFRESLKYAKQFIKNGYRLFFLEEFSSIASQIKTLLTMFKNGLKFIRIERGIIDSHTFGDYNFYPLLRDDWYSSFVGIGGYIGVSHYYTFSSLLSRLKARKCLYHSWEMQAWEKALMSAKESTGSPMDIYAYQSGTMPRMLLNLFNNPREIIDDKFYAMPRPDKIICNGELHYGYVRESGWPEENIIIAEAIRYSHFKKSLEKKWCKKKDVVLLAFSISPEESSSILTITYESLKDLKDKEVWVKPHPFLDLKRVLELSGIPEENFPFKLKTGPIEDLLSDARVVIVGESGVSIEALAFGCDVVTVNVPEWINMSPLRYVKTEMTRVANSPEELRQIVTGIFKEEYRSEIHAVEARRIINRFFCLNQDSDFPSRLLSLLK